MKKLLTLFLSFVAVMALQAQNISITNADCSTGSGLSGSGPWTSPGYTITQAATTNFQPTNSGIISGKLVVKGVANGAITDLILTTDKYDISTIYPSQTNIFAFSCNLSLGVAAGTASPYNTGVIAYNSSGTAVTTGFTVSQTTPAVNVAGAVSPNTVSIGATITITDPAITQIAFKVGCGKMEAQTLYFDDFTLTYTSATTSVGTPSNSNLSYEVGAGPSSESTFTVSGSNLGTSAIVLTPTTNIEISTTSGSGFIGSTGSLTLTPTSGTVNATTIYARLKSGINSLGIPTAAGTRVTVTHATAGSKTVQFNGYVNGITSSVAGGSSVSYVEGAGPSAEKTITVQGAGLTADLVVTPGENIEISTTSGSGFASTPITLTQSGGAVAATPIYARLKAGLPVGTYNDASTLVSVSSTGFTNKDIQFDGSVGTYTGINGSNSAVKCVVLKGAIQVSGAEVGTAIEVYNNVGQKVYASAASTLTTITLPQSGVYVVRIGDVVRKVVLR